MLVAEDHLVLVGIETRVDGQQGPDLLAGEVAALHTGLDQQVGHGHAQHLDLLVGDRLQSQRTAVETCRDPKDQRTADTGFKWEERKE